MTGFSSASIQAQTAKRPDNTKALRSGAMANDMISDEAKMCMNPPDFMNSFDFHVTNSSIHMAINDRGCY